MTDIADNSIPVAGPLSGSELLPALQGAGAVKVAVSQLFERGAGGSLPLKIGGVERFTVTDAGGIATGTVSARGKSADAGEMHGSFIGRRYDGTAMWSIGCEPSGANTPLRIETLNGSPISLLINGVERERILSSGTHLFGKSASASHVPGCEIYPEGIMYLTRDGYQALVLSRLSSAGALVDCRYGAANVGSISVTPTSTAFNTTSDYRVKINLEPLRGALDRVMSIPVHRFNFTQSPDGPKVDGFLAHEAQAKVPESVTGTKDAIEEVGVATGYRERDPETGVPILTSKEVIPDIPRSEVPEGYDWVKTGERPILQQIDQSKLVPVLWAAVQEHYGLTRALLQQVANLEARVAALESAA